MNRDGAADATGVKKLFDAQMLGVVPPFERLGQKDAVSIGDCDHLLTFGGGDADRLFYEDGPHLA